MAKELSKDLQESKKQFDKFDEEVKTMTLDRMNQAPKLEVEPQTKLSQKDIEKSNDIYLKPNRMISSQEKFNEAYREDYNFQKEYVQFIAENKELIGETIEMWTKPFPGMPAEEWKVPTNKPVWGPRYLAEQIKKAKHHRLVMQQGHAIDGFSFGRPLGSDGVGSYIGGIVAETTIQRLDAYPVNTRRSIFMGAS